MVKRFAFVVLILFLAVALLLVVIPLALSSSPLLVAAVLGACIFAVVGWLGRPLRGAGPMSPRSPPRA